MSSFLTQYGVRIYSNDFKKMKWDEFSSLLSGLSEDTPLGKIVLIRSETDRNIIKNMTTAQKKIRNDWLSKHSRKTITKKDTEIALENFKQIFINIAKRG